MALFALFLIGVTHFPTGTLAQDRHADPTLEMLLPASLGGVMLTRESQNGVELKQQSGPFEAFLKGLGKETGDFTVASAYASGIAAEVGAWRVKDLSAERTFPGFKSALQASSRVQLDFAVETLAGRTVTRIGSAQQLARGPLYVVLHGDALLFVQTSESKLAEEAIGKLPR